MLHCVTAFTCFCPFYAIPTSLLFLWKMFIIPSLCILYRAALDRISCNLHFRNCTDIYIYNSVRLFVSSRFGQNYCTGHHQTLRDCRVGLQKCPPWVEIVHLAVLEEISFNLRFSLTADSHFMKYHSLASSYQEV